jgi:hypothetical protein
LWNLSEVSYEGLSEDKPQNGTRSIDISGKTILSEVNINKELNFHQLSAIKVFGKPDFHQTSSVKIFRKIHIPSNNLIKVFPKTLLPSNKFNPNL